MIDIETPVGDVYDCPEHIQDIHNYPMYISVALWGMRTNQLLTVENISRKFGLSQKAAKNILYYIEHDGKKYISSKRFIQTSPSTGRKRLLKIQNVQIPELSKIKIKEPITGNDKKVYLFREKTHTRFEKIRHWMLHRKANETMPSELLIDKD